jgi:hypothetical protein
MKLPPLRRTSVRSVPHLPVGDEHSAWIPQNLFRPNQALVVNVVAVVLILLSMAPIWLAQRLSAGSVGVPAK